MIKALFAGFLLFIVVTDLLAQDIFEFDVTQSVPQPPRILTETRSAVVVNTFGDWKLFSKQIHRQFKRMGIDAVFYILYRDIHASATVERELAELFEKRSIQQVFLIDQQRDQTRIAIIPRSQGNVLDLGSETWFAQEQTFMAALLQLGLKMKAMDLEYSNFLISDEPEYIADLPLVEGTHLKSYPTGIKRFPLAVTQFSEIKETADSSPRIKQYNVEVRAKNAKLKSLFADYPHEVTFVSDMTDDDLYNSRFQYVLRWISTSGETIERMLNYPNPSDTKEIVSTTPLPGGGRTMKTFDRNKEVTKFYIKQTYTKDAYVGRFYDADETWELALSNFIGHMLTSFEK